MPRTRRNRKRTRALVALLLLIPTLACALTSPSSDATSTPDIIEAATAVPDVPAATVTPLPKPSRTPSPGGSTTIVVAADGTGDYGSLEEAVGAALPGATITLSPGTYRLASGLVIDKSLTLVGAGIDLTEIVGASGDFVVRFTGARSADDLSGGTFTANDLTFSNDGPGDSDVLRVDGGTIELQRCRFTGAVYGAGSSIPRRAARLWDDDRHRLGVRRKQQQSRRHPPAGQGPAVAQRQHLQLQHRDRHPVPRRHRRHGDRQHLREQRAERHQP